MCFGPDIPEQDPRFAEAAGRQMDLAEREYNDYVGPGGDREWMRGVASEALGISRDQATRAGRMQDYQLGQMERNDERYWRTAVPFENELLAQVKEMDSEAYREQQAGLAKADVAQEFDAGKAGLVRDLARYGMMDSPGAAVALARNQQGRQLAMATAANKTRLAAQQVGLANKMQMYGGMKGLSGLGATSAGIALGAGQLGLGAGSAMTGAVGSSLAANTTAQGMRNAGMSAGINGYSNLYNGQVGAYTAAANNDPGQMLMGVAAGGLTRWGMNKLFPTTPT